MIEPQLKHDGVFVFSATRSFLLPGRGVHKSKRARLLPSTYCGGGRSPVDALSQWKGADMSSMIVFVCGRSPTRCRELASGRIPFAFAVFFCGGIALAPCAKRPFPLVEPIDCFWYFWCLALSLFRLFENEKAAS